MEYIFGTQDEKEVLKTKGNAHTDLIGYNQIEQSYPDQSITDHFRIVEKINSKEDSEGNCYDWYEIDRHYRIVNKVSKQEQKNTANIDYLAMMLDIDLEESINE